MQHKFLIFSLGVNKSTEALLEAKFPKQFKSQGARSLICNLFMHKYQRKMNGVLNQLICDVIQSVPSTWDDDGVPEPLNSLLIDNTVEFPGVLYEPGPHGLVPKTKQDRILHKEFFRATEKLIKQRYWKNTKGFHSYAPNPEGSND